MGTLARLGHTCSGRCAFAPRLAAVASAILGPPGASLFGTNALAAAREGRTAPVDVVSPKELRRMRAAEREDTSEANREDKWVAIAVEAPSFIPWPGGGLSLGVFLQRDLVVEAAATAHFGWSGPSKSESWHTELYQLQGRFFFADSFTLALGGAVQTWTEKDVFEAKAGEETEPFTQTWTMTYGAQAALGNHWQWKVFSAGIDWVGIYLPFGVAARSFHSEGLGDDEVRTERKRLESATPVIVPEFLKVRLGVSF